MKNRNFGWLVAVYGKSTGVTQAIYTDDPNMTKMAYSLFENKNIYID